MADEVRVVSALRDLVEQSQDAELREWADAVLRLLGRRTGPDGTGSVRAARLRSLVGELAESLEDDDVPWDVLDELAASDPRAYVPLSSLPFVPELSGVVLVLADPRELVGALAAGLTGSAGEQRETLRVLAQAAPYLERRDLLGAVRRSDGDEPGAQAALAALGALVVPTRARAAVADPEGEREVADDRGVITDLAEPVFMMMLGVAFQELLKAATKGTWGKARDQLARFRAERAAGRAVERQVEGGGARLEIPAGELSTAALAALARADLETLSAPDQAGGQVLVYWDPVAGVWRRHVTPPGSPA